jgi:hypothetical protein
MLKRQKLIQVVLAGVMVLALCGTVLAGAATWWGPQPEVNWNSWLGGQPVATLTLPWWGPQPEVNWNSWLGGQQVAFWLPPDWGPQPQVNWNS